MSDDAQLKLRVPQDLKEFLESESKSNYRTINGEVVYRLDQSRYLSNEKIKASAEEFGYLLASALIEEEGVECKQVQGFKQPTINGIKQAFQNFLFRDPSNRKNLGVEDIEGGVRFYNENEEYIIKSDNLHYYGAYKINHLSKILEKLYFLPMLLSK